MLQVRNSYSIKNDHGVGKIWKNEDYMIVIDREQLLISNIKDLNNIQEQRAFRLPEEGIYNMDEGTQIKIRIFSHMGDFMPSKESQCITLDAEKFSPHLPTGKRRR